VKVAMCRWGTVRLGVSQVAIAFVLWGGGCGSNGNSGLRGPAGSGASGASARVGTSGTATGASGKAGSKSGAGTNASDGASGTIAAGVAGAGGGAPGGASGTKNEAGAGGASGAKSQAGAGGASGDAGASGSGGTSVPASSCLDGITDYENDGPFKFEAKTAGSVNFWVPMVPAGCKVPVIHLAGGTGALCSSYQPALERLATHGFLTTCYESPQTGAGDQGIMAFDAAFKMYPELADNKLGSTGHEQGGQAAFAVLELAEKKWGHQMIYAGLAMEPASGIGSALTDGTWQEVYAKIESPMFMFSALGTDGLVSQAWVQQAYDALSPTEEAYFWTANGATTVPVPNGEEREISIPWFRWKLLGDQKACAFFKAIPMTNTKWAEVASKSSTPCM
jgi:hypothetical protein